MQNFAALLLLIAATTTSLAAQQTDSLNKLSEDFWAWRAKYAPFNGDDVPRMERPGGIRDWSRAAIEKRRKDLAEFIARWKTIDLKGSPIPTQVDYRLIGSALLDAAQPAAQEEMSDAAASADVMAFA